MKNETAILCVKNKRTYNIGNGMNYYGLIVGLIGLTVSMIGLYVKHNSFDPSVIVGGDGPRADFYDLVSDILKRKES